jgi:hypothetical protein
VRFSLLLFCLATACIADPCASTVLRLLSGNQVSVRLKDGTRGRIERIHDGRTEWLFLKTTDGVPRSSLSFEVSSDGGTLEFLEAATEAPYRGRGMYRTLVKTALALHPKARVLRVKFAYDNYLPADLNPKLEATISGAVLTSYGFSLKHFHHQPDADPPLYETEWMKP